MIEKIKTSYMKMLFSFILNKQLLQINKFKLNISLLYSNCVSTFLHFMSPFLPKYQSVKLLAKLSTRKVISKNCNRIQCSGLCNAMQIYVQ